MILDERISLERMQAGVWTTIDASRPASVHVLKGNELFRAAQWIAREQAEFLIRWSPNLANLNPKDSVVFNGERYDIIEVSELPRRAGLRIIGVATNA